MEGTPNMSVFNSFKDKVTKLEAEGKTLLTEAVQSHESQTDVANQLLRDQQALERSSQHSTTLVAESLSNLEPAQ